MGTSDLQPTGSSTGDNMDLQFMSEVGVRGQSYGIEPWTCEVRDNYG